MSCLKRFCRGLVAAAAVIGLPAAAQAQDCNSNGAGTFVNANGTFTIEGGQVNLSGASLFVDFFRAPASTNDWIDADADGHAGYDPAWFPFFVDQLATPYSPGSNLNSWWTVSYRSVGSVNGFNEFVSNQTCGSIPLNIPSEFGLFNGFEYANAGVVKWANGVNMSGTPLEQCAIQGAFLDVPTRWAVQVPGAPAWNRKPLESGYGLCDVPSSSGAISNLDTLSRTCGACTVTGAPCTNDLACSDWFVKECSSNGVFTGTLCAKANGDADPTKCAVDETCLPHETCNTAGGATVSLNQNSSSPDADTVFDFVGAWVPVAVIANRGTQKQDIKFSELQYLFATGRLPNGENLIAATRDVGSGTRNAIMNSIGVDTSWGRGDNIGTINNTSGLANLGPGTQAANCGGSGIMETAVQNRRLAVGYTGLAGASRAAQDAVAGNYEILNTQKDVNSNGDALCTAGYVRPNVNTVIHNCDPCTGYQIAGSGSFAVRGDPNANRTPRVGTHPAVDNQAVADYLNNIFDSIADFSADPFSNTCAESKTCSTKTCSVSGIGCTVDADCAPSGGTCSVLVRCLTSADCPVGGSCSGAPWPCTTDSQCNTAYKECTVSGMICNSNGNCDAGETCFAADYCKGADNMPAQFLATDFFLPASVDCLHQVTDPMVYADAAVNETLQSYALAHNTTVVPAYGTVNAAGKRPVRNTLTGSARYSDGTTGSYCNAPPSNLTARYAVQGDMNNNGARDLGDAVGLVTAYFTPRAWTVANAAVAEIIADFDGDGSLNKADLRYWMDGLALSGGHVDRKQGAIAIDNQFTALGKPFPWADTAEQLVPPAVACNEPTFNAPAAIGNIWTTGKAYAAGDFRGDVAGGHPVAGAQPMGYDGRINAADIDYVCANIGDWSNLGQAVKMDLSCDMTGDAAVTSADVTELVTVILGTQFGDANLDGVVNGADTTIVMNTIASGTCNATHTCGWANGDFNCDRVVDWTDLAYTPAGDCDANGSVDLVDYQDLAACLAGPGGGLGVGCSCFDFNADGDVDLQDYSLFMVTFGF
jgi:hypothetical protein